MSRICVFFSPEGGYLIGPDGQTRKPGRLSGSILHGRFDRGLDASAIFFQLLGQFPACLPEILPFQVERDGGAAAFADGIPHRPRHRSTTAAIPLGFRRVLFDPVAQFVTPASSWTESLDKGFLPRARRGHSPTVGAGDSAGMAGWPDGLSAAVPIRQAASKTG